ncbi:UNVERIFIED_CONTAM: hypothetical protein RMT77_002980 [Armadillidium vulgare]
METERWTESINLRYLSRKEREQQIEIATDPILKLKFQELPKFWMELLMEYLDINSKALKVIMRFSTTYSCERIFSLHARTKNKFKNRLNIEADLRL